MSKGQEAASFRDEGWYRSLFDLNVCGLFVANSEGAIVQCNRAFAELLGYSAPEQLASKGICELFQQITDWPAIFGKLRQKGPLTNHEWCATGSKGNRLWLLISLSHLEGPLAPGLAAGSAIDITERKVDDEETQKHLRLTASIAELGRQALGRSTELDLAHLTAKQVAADLEVDFCQIGKFLAPGDTLQFVAGAGADLPVANRSSSGNAKAETGGKQILPGADLLMEEGYASAMSVVIGSDQGPRGILSVHSHKVRYFDDQEVSYLQSAANILAAALTQQETDQELRTSEERLRLAMEAAALGIWDRDLKTEQITWSGSQAQLFGLPPDRLQGTTAELRALIHPDDQASVERTLEKAIEDKAAFTHEFRIVRHDGIHWIAGKGRFFYDEAGLPYRAMGVTMDVSERRRAEEQSHLRDRALEAVSQGIMITDSSLDDNPIIYVNQGFERVTGFDRAEAIGRNCRFLQGPATDVHVVDEIRRSIERKVTCYCELLNYRKDGSTFWNALSISPVRNEQGQVRFFLGVMVDVTERRRLEDQYRHAQKMEAVGRFAGGVAHDFNNLLTVINGYSDMLLEMMPPESDIHKLAYQIRHAGERGANLTRQILLFSRHKGAAPQALDVNFVIRDMEQLLGRLIGEDLEIQTVLDSALKAVKIDPAQIDQVIVNLVINARDAMPRGGLITVSTAGVDLTDADLPGRSDAKPGGYAMLTIRDTGIGMDDATKSRVFEPFFTTKGAKGTGLGLATVYSIVHQANGFIELESTPGQGTAFRVFLPCVEEPAIIDQPQRTLDKIPHSNETILLVEDEDGVRQFVRHTLQQAGFQVLEAAGGPEALEISRRFSQPIHLLVSDVVMPRMSGRELADRLQKLRPEIKVLFISGYVDDSVVQHGVLHDEVVFLQKPFDAAALAAKVQEALSRR